MAKKKTLTQRRKKARPNGCKNGFKKGKTTCRKVRRGRKKR